MRMKALTLLIGMVMVLAIFAMMPSASAGKLEGPGSTPGGHTPPGEIIHRLVQVTPPTDRGRLISEMVGEANPQPSPGRMDPPCSPTSMNLQPSPVAMDPQPSPSPVSMNPQPSPDTFDPPTPSPVSMDPQPSPAPVSMNPQPSPVAGQNPNREPPHREQ